MVYGVFLDYDIIKPYVTTINHDFLTIATEFICVHLSEIFAVYSFGNWNSCNIHITVQTCSRVIFMRLAY